MTTDEFTAAARAEVEEAAVAFADETASVGSQCAPMETGFIGGVKWARDHPAAQEPTDEEAREFDGHTTQDVHKRLRDALGIEES